jgi:hypothetical protein
VSDLVRLTGTRYRTNGGRRDALGHDHALVIRDGAPAILPLSEATPFELESGIASIEAVCLRVVDRYCASSGVYMTDDRRHDAVAHLLSSAWHEAGRFNGNGRLASFIVSRLRWRIIDWARLNIGTPAGVETVSLEALHESVESPGPAADADPFDELGVEPEHLSDEAAFALSEIAYPISQGETITSVCERTSWSRHAVKAALEQLRVELVALGVGP